MGFPVKEAVYRSRLPTKPPRATKVVLSVRTSVLPSAPPRVVRSFSSCWLLLSRSARNPPNIFGVKRRQYAVVRVSRVVFVPVDCPLKVELALAVIQLRSPRYSAAALNEDCVWLFPLVKLNP